MFKQNSNTQVHTDTHAKQQVPAGIFLGKCKVVLARIYNKYQELDPWYSTQAQRLLTQVRMDVHVSETHPLNLIGSKNPRKMIDVAVYTCQRVNLGQKAT